METQITQTMELSELKSKTMSELLHLSQELNIEGTSGESEINDACRKNSRREYMFLLRIVQAS